jgi:hypothetical protein
MKNVSIKNVKLFEVIDEATSDIYYGGWQEWYGVWWKRLSGCGPTTVSTIVSYLNRSGAGADIECPPLPKKEFQALMDRVWQYVTPSVRGIPSAAALKKGAVGCLAALNLDMAVEELDIPKNRRLRPDFEKLVEFLRESLENDIPVAFLSLDNGEEPLLDTWHWVTLLGLQYGEDGSAAFADVADEGKLLHVDLRKWYDTTGVGGGFVRFVRKTQ